VSCKIISSDELARTMPVSPPTVNRKIKPRAQSIAGDHLMFPP
jgi:DNA-binding transcriptional regulator YdaS (Cro superfamily)